MTDNFSEELRKLPEAEAFKKVCEDVEKITRSTPDFWTGLRYGWNAAIDYRTNKSEEKKDA